MLYVYIHTMSFNLDHFNNLCSELCSVAKKSHLDNKLAAVIIKNGKMIAPPSYNTQRNKNILDGSLHAETNAIVKYFGNNVKITNSIYSLKDKNKIERISIFVIRINKNNEICNARPCYNCLNVMKNFGIRKVYYSVPNKIICENVRSMISIQSSSLTIHTEKMNGNKLLNNKNLYYEALIKQYFPQIIHQHNLINFLIYNFTNVLPKYKVQIVYNNKCKYVYITNENDKHIIKSTIIS